MSSALAHSACPVTAADEATKAKFPEHQDPVINYTDILSLDPVATSSSERPAMKHIVIILTSIAMAGAPVVSFPGNARADNGQIAASVVGDLAAGTVLGAATTSRPHYYVPVHIEPVYAEPHCYWPRGELVWNDSRQAWVRSGVQVCD
jgi:hypothetical protein